MFVEQKAATSQLVQADKYKCKCEVFHSFIVGTSRLRTPLHDLVFPVSQNHIFCKASPAKPGSESGLLALYSKGSEYHKVSDSICVSDVQLSLSDYIKGRQLYCSERHKTPCTKCESMLRVAQIVHTAGYCSLPHAFKIVSPGVKYKKARRLLLQMPLVSIGNPAKGNSFTILIEHCRGVDYSKISLMLDGLFSSCANKNPQGLEKRCVKMLLSLAASDCE